MIKNIIHMIVFISSWESKSHFSYKDTKCHTIKQGVLQKIIHQINN